jgi:hypothetical protein
MGWPPSLATIARIRNALATEDVRRLVGEAYAKERLRLEMDRARLVAVRAFGSKEQLFVCPGALQ